MMKQSHEAISIEHKGLRNREFHPLKVLQHVKRLETLANGGDIAPVTVEIDPVAYCNHACAWCVDPVHYSATMTDGLYEALITELAAFKVSGDPVEGIVFKGGGEPTLHKRFGPMVDRAVELGFSVGVVTNGSQLLQYGDQLGRCASYVRVSIDGPTPESHHHIHRSHDFHDIIAGVETLVAAREDRRHPIIGLSFAMDISTSHEAGEAIALGERHGVDYVLLRPPFYEEVGSDPTMTVDEARAVRRQLREAAQQYVGPMEVIVGQWVGDVERHSTAGPGVRPGPTPAAPLEPSGRRDLHVTADVPIEHRTGRCTASPLLAVVTADGTVYGCCNLRALPDWSFGRLDYEAGIGFGQLWSGSQRHEAIARMHCTECIRHCTHPLSRYNEIIEIFQQTPWPHRAFV